MEGYSRPPERDDTDIIGARIIAQILDQIFAAVIVGAIVLVLGGTGALIGGNAGDVVTGLGLLIALLVFPIYFFLLEGLWDGHTLGKKLVGIKVVKEDGSECDITASLLRNIFRAIDAIGYYVIGFIFMASSDRRQRLGDRVAGTVVVREE